MLAGIEVGWYGPVWHTGSSFLRSNTGMFAGHFVRFRQLVADVCIDQ